MIPVSRSIKQLLPAKNISLYVLLLLFLSSLFFLLLFLFVTYNYLVIFSFLSKTQEI